MEIRFNAGDTVTIPENCTAKIENGIVVFEPMEGGRWKPRQGQYYFLPFFDKKLYDSRLWLNSNVDESLFDKFVIFETIPEAIAASKKMLEALKK